VSAHGGVVATRAAERRREERVACDPPAGGLLVVDGRDVRVDVLDSSPRGARLRLEAARLPREALEQGRAVSVLQGSPADPRCPARVAWVAPGYGGGLEVGLALELGSGLSAREIDLERVAIDPAWALRLPAILALRRNLLPLCAVDGRLVIACADAADARLAVGLERHVDLPFDLRPANPAALSSALRRVHGESRPGKDGASEEPVALFAEILHAALLRSASDIHVCPERDGVHVRLRVDGVLETYRVLPARVQAELLSRIKVLSGMDIAERRAPQDGRLPHELPDGRRIQLRVATLPTPLGERATLRLLGIHTQSLTLGRLGLREVELARLERAFDQSNGLVLSTGPTGSGKSTTLHAALRHILGRRSVNAISVEEPIEFELAGVTQVEVDASQKITFASALRSILRNDPDVILVGEIRDQETADLAIKAALTGHLVLATLHTNSAAGAITRLIDMGVPRYLVADTLRCVVAQRLVRRLCGRCSTAALSDARAPRALGWTSGGPRPVREAHGCVYCAGRGYAGRSGVFEVLDLDGDLAELVAEARPERALLEAAREKGMRALRDDVEGKLLDGTTSLDEARGALGA
jgi:type IV pilus assembly protein PilB